MGARLCKREQDIALDDSKEAHTAAAALRLSPAATAPIQVEDGPLPLGLHQDLWCASILPFLYARERVLCSFVCRGLWKAVWNPLTWKELYFYSPNQACLETLLLSSSVVRRARVRCLVLDGRSGRHSGWMKHVNAEMLCTALNHCIGPLSVFRSELCYGVDDRVISSLVLGLSGKSLTHLNVRRCSITRHALHEICQLPLLAHLNISELSLRGGEIAPLKLPWEKLAGHLEQLSAASCSVLTSLEELLPACSSSLQTLDVSHNNPCVSQGDVLERICVAAPHLKTLNLGGMENVDSVRHVSHLQSLSSLDLVNGWWRQNQVGYLSHLTGLKQLRCLLGVSLQPTCVIHLRAMRQLQALELVASTLLCGPDLGLIACLTQLRRLSLRAAPTKTRSDVEPDNSMLDIEAVKSLSALRALHSVEAHFTLDLQDGEWPDCHRRSWRPLTEELRRDGKRMATTIAQVVCGWQSLDALALRVDYEVTGGAGVYLTELSCLSALRVLDLTNCHLSESTASTTTFPSPPRLLFLGLAHCTSPSSYVVQCKCQDSAAALPNSIFKPPARCACCTLEFRHVTHGHIAYGSVDLQILVDRLPRLRRLSLGACSVRPYEQVGADATGAQDQEPSWMAPDRVKVEWDPSCMRRP